VVATLEIKLFGVFCLERGGQPLPAFPSRKVRDLLAYLLLDHRALHSREHLADLFWPDLDGDKARHCLNTTLWRLRGVLGQTEGGACSYLRVDAERIGFNPASDFRLDVDEFAVACRNAERAGPHLPDQRAQWDRTAVDLYRADLLTDCYDDWCLVERERLQLLSLRALGRLLDYHHQQHDYDAAIAYGQRILACDPMREQVHRQLIHLYLAAGNPAAALRQYERCEEMVRRDLGTDLLPETKALLPRLLGQVAGTQQGHAQVRTGPVLPAPSSGAVGSLEEAVALVQQARAQLAEATRLLETIKRRMYGEAGQFSARQRPALPAEIGRAERVVAARL
jgi:DNA-binding SARP family transcriptional activator